MKIGDIVFVRDLPYKWSEESPFIRRYGNPLDRFGEIVRWTPDGFYNVQVENLRYPLWFSMTSIYVVSFDVPEIEI